MEENSNTTESLAERSTNTAVVGLDVGGHRPLFYLSRTTLQQSPYAGDYFAARFRPDSFLSNPPLYRSSTPSSTGTGGGVDVYFVERDGSLFQYIHAYILMGAPPHLLPPSLPSFADHPALWRALRAEAIFFGLDSLIRLLQTTYTCHPDTHGDRGVLYWLGTAKGKEQYVNPLLSSSSSATAATIDIHCWLNTVASPADGDAMRRHVSRSCERFVHYRVPVDNIFERDSSLSSMSSSSPMMVSSAVLGHALSVSYASLSGLGGKFAYGVVKPVVLDLKSIRLRPTHFSLRSTGAGSTETRPSWKFQGSVDGSESSSWVTLYQSSTSNDGDDSTNAELRDITLDVKRSFLKTFREQKCDNYVTLATDFVERQYRRYWTITDPPDMYFRYFRFVGDSHGGEGFTEELPQGTGLELYGDVWEE